MSLIHTARIAGHEPLAYLTDVLDRLPMHPAGRIDELLPYNCKPTPIPQPDTSLPHGPFPSSDT